MSAKLAVVGAVTAGLFAVGGVASAIAFQPAPVREVQMIQPAADVSTPTADPTTAAPAPVESTQAPAPVESTQAPAPVATSAPEVVVPKAVEPAPVVVPTPAETGSAPAVNGARPKVGYPAPAGGVGGDPLATPKPTR